LFFWKSWPLCEQTLALSLPAGISLTISNKIGNIHLILGG